VRTSRLTGLAMTIAATMLAHQVAAKSVRDAAFLTAWSAARLPVMVIATSVLVVAFVPVFSRLLARFGPRLVVPTGFLLSAAGHLVEWRLWESSPWLSVVLYLHVAGFGALLLSGFWSYISEVFDPATAKTNFGRIAAAGTLGGLTGGLISERMAALLPEQDTLFFLAGVHAAASVGLVAMALVTRRQGPRQATEAGRLFEFDVLRTAPHLRTLALLILLGTAGAGIIDFLLKEQAEQTWNEAGLQRFFAIFYAAVQLLTFVAQTAVGPSVRRLGLGRTVSSLPAGLGLMSTVVLLVPVFSLFVVARGVESVLRGSLYRSGYELLFVPMDPGEKRRTKTFLDVTCDRAGEALGALVVQAALLVLAAGVLVNVNNVLLGAVIATAVCSVWLGGRLDVMYRRVVERRLVGQLPVTPAVIGSETAWTVIELPPAVEAERPRTRDAARVKAEPPPVLDPRLQALVELRSGDRNRVEKALASTSRPDALVVAQAIELLAWDDVVASARQVLEAAAPAHVGLLTDRLLDSHADFAIRRRIPRVLGHVPTRRALDGLLAGLDDSRFEVRYQCSRAIDRLRSKHPELTVDRHHILSVVERELSVPKQIWSGHRIIDEDDRDDSAAGPPSDRAQRGTEHVFSLLASILPREPLTVAFRGLHSADRSLRGVSLEYFDNVLPPAIRARLHLLLTDDDAG